MPRGLDRFYDRLSRIPHTPLLFLLVPPIIGTVRIFEEELLHGGKMNFDHGVYHVAIGYLLLQMMMLLALRVATGRPWRELTGVVSVGLLLAWLPPVFDLWFTNPEHIHYVYFREFRWSFVAGEQMAGESLTLWLVVFSAGVYAAWATRHPGRTLLGMLLGWSALQVYAWGWPALTIELFGQVAPRLQVDFMNFVALVLILLVWALLNPRTMWRSLARFNHALPFGLAATIAARMAGGEWLFVVPVGVGVALAFQLVVVANDYFDREQDAAGGAAARGATRDDMYVATLLQVYLLGWLLFFYPNAVGGMVLFLAGWACYHHPELRLKRFFPVSYVIEGLAGAASFIIGIYVLGPRPEGDWAPFWTLMAFSAFFAGSVFKDYKDVEQDRAAGVETFYTRNVELGRSPAVTHGFVVGVTVVTFLVTPLWYWVVGRPTWQVGLLAALACVPGGLLLLIPNRRLAVETTLLAYAAFLATVALTVPSLVAVTPPG